MDSSAIVPIIVAVITGGLSVVGVIISNYSSNKEMENKLVTAQAVTDTKLDNLTKEVRNHNGFATRIPAIEVKVSQLEKDVDNLKAKIGG